MPGNNPATEDQQRPHSSAIDNGVPHSARIYDYWLGGKDNFAADRAVAEALISAIPTVRSMAAENRRFVHRVARYLVGQAGVRQFLDVGTGIPTRPNLHEVAQEIAPETRVVYVDNDPIVLAHARALMISTEQGRSEYIHADLREPELIVNHRKLREVLDLNRPVALTIVATLMLLEDAEDPWRKIRVLMDALPSGSYVAITHPTGDFNPEAVKKAVDAAVGSGMTLVPRSRDEVARFFAGWDLVEPGIVPVAAWQPDDGAPTDPHAAYYWAGIARKP